MKKISIVILFFLLLFSSCMSTGDVNKSRDKALKELRKIEQLAKEGDVEALIENLGRFLEENDLTYDDLKDSKGVTITREWIEDILEEGYLNELYKNAIHFADNILEMDEKELKEYTDSILYYSKKVGKNMLTTIKLLTTYFKENGIEFPETEFIKKLTKIWINND